MYILTKKLKKYQKNHEYFSLKKSFLLVLQFRNTLFDQKSQFNPFFESRGKRGGGRSPIIL